MKKWIVFVCTVLFVCAAAAFSFAEGEMALHLLDSSLIQQDTTCTLHLKLYKEGGTEFCFGQPNVTLFDEDAQPIDPVSVEMIAPLNPVPAGSTAYPVTLIYTLPEGGAASSFQLRSLTGQQVNEASATPMEAGWDHLLKTSGGESTFSIWTEEPMELAEIPEHFIIAYLYGEEEEFLGIMYLDNQNTGLYGMDGDALAYSVFDCGAEDGLLALYGISLEADREYCAYLDIPADCLSEGKFPVSADVDVFLAKKPLRMLISSMERLEGNDWRICYVMKNDSCEHVYDAMHDVILHDADGQTYAYTGGCGTTLTNLIAPFAAVPFVDEITLPEGFVPVRAELDPDWIPLTGMDWDAPDYAEVEGSYEMERIDGKWYVTATIPFVQGREDDAYAFWFFAMDAAQTTFYSCNLCDAGQPTATEDGLVFPPAEVLNYTGSQAPVIFPVYCTAEFFFAY